ncbi:NAD(P)/FAD-dependent oxidoreductase [Nocardia brasiliensis]|uniref:NAD(P)/FAD-dependent oxidoreductase n=1 Tax=Nocardia brasiliensis TaxID=37326 RepID=UPI00245555A1|nr:NAD(P)/FAD-dependent oxidoreductase [Nocardia brasiliensis]
MITDRSDYDVVVLGGGLAGLSVARQMLLRRPETTVLVVERVPHPVRAAAHKVGESTVVISGTYFAETLQLREHLEQAQIRKTGLRFLPSVSVPPPPLSQRAESGPSGFFYASATFQLDRGVFENALGEIVAAGGAEFRHGYRVVDVRLKSGAPHEVVIARAGAGQTVRARWVIDATGRRGLLKSKLGLRKDSPHNCDAVWFRLSEMIWMDELAEEEVGTSAAAKSAWRERVPEGLRWRSTNHLMGKGYWVWLIPLVSGSISVGIVSDPRYVPFEEIGTFEAALDWLTRHEPEVARAVTRHQESLQDFKRLRHFAHSCAQVYSGDRWALTGEAGVFNDPLYSPGSDFIAMSNTLVTDMVVRDLGGAAIDDLAARLNDFYLEVYDTLLPVWTDQYRLMGNPQVWFAKLIFDRYLHHAFLGLLIRSNTTDAYAPAVIGAELAGFRLLNERMQAFFREWDEREPGRDHCHFFDHTGTPALKSSFGTSGDHGPLGSAEIRRRLGANRRVLEAMMQVIMARAATRIGYPTAACDIDPRTFTLGDLPLAGKRADRDQDALIEFISELLQDNWLPVSPVEVAG